VGISVEDAEEYTQALGQVVAGGWRQIALGKRLGVPQALGLTVREWVETRLGGYVRMSIEERRQAVLELAEEGHSQREIAEVLGVSKTTVDRDLDPGPSGPPEQLVDEYQQVDTPVHQDTGPNGPPMPVGQEHADAILADIDQRVAERAETVRDTEPQPTLVEPEPAPPRVQVNEGDEWYTPKWLFDALGIRFSIDVCAPLDRTFSSVPAERHFTIEDDGLAQPWEGTVWCNPPYSKAEPWARRMIHHGDGLLLTHVPMNAGWCIDVWEACDAIRLFQAMEFVRPDGTSQRPAWWLQLAAFGPAATEALARLQPLGDAALNRRRVASPMWRRAE